MKPRSKIEIDRDKEARDWFKARGFKCMTYAEFFGPPSEAMIADAANRKIAEAQAVLDDLALRRELAEKRKEWKARRKANPPVWVKT